MDLLFNNIKPAYGFNKSKNSKRLAQRAVNACSTFSLHLLLQRQCRLLFVFFFADGYLVCPDTFHTPVSSDVSTFNLQSAVCQRYISLYQHPHFLASNIVTSLFLVTFTNITAQEPSPTPNSVQHLLPKDPVNTVVPRVSEKASSKMRFGQDNSIA